MAFMKIPTIFSNKKLTIHKNNKYRWKNDFLPIINNVYNNKNIEVIKETLGVTNNINEN